jgi:hypothetical protein
MVFSCSEKLFQLQFEYQAKTVRGFSKGKFLLERGKKMKKTHLIISIFTFFLIAVMAPYLPAADINEPQQSTTGPVPPKTVLEQDRVEIQKLKMLTLEKMEQLLVTQHIISGVPEYFWRHGCGPTAVGMVLGYYDIHGYGDLIPGDASTQTNDVNQAIASGGDYDNPYPPGSEKHYEDYSQPEDGGGMITDDYITKGRTAHANNCIADYMDTSKSTRSNLYGWSWSNDLGTAFTGYVNQQHPSYNPQYTQYKWSGSTLTWDVLKNEIDSNRPMVFLIDTDGNGSTDHFVPIIGYDDSVPRQFACYTTWTSMPGIRWYTFQGMHVGNSWGIWGGWSLRLSPPPPPPAGDLNGDYKVNFFDYAIFANGYTGTTDNWLSLKDIADTWLQCNLANQGTCW